MAQLTKLDAKTFSAIISCGSWTYDGVITIEQINSTQLGDYPDYFVISHSKQSNPFLDEIQPKIDAITAASNAGYGSTQQ